LSNSQRRSLERLAAQENGILRGERLKHSRLSMI
jgi:hypothetical protein